jgi:dihydrofolate reductase
VFVSLDGVIQAPGGPDEDKSGGFRFGGWVEPVADEGFGEAIDRLFAGDFDLLLGRRTFEIFAGYWPFQPAGDPIRTAFDKARKFVLSHADLALDWANSHRLADLEALRALKATDGPNLIIQGSATLYPQLLEHGLIDRLILMIAPVTIGEGKRLFGPGTPAGTMKLVEQNSTSGGWLIATYEPAGALKTGTFETQPPSDLERARRARVEAGTW